MGSYRVCSVFLLAAVGCAPTPAAVSGRVTYDGQPLADGYVTFYPVGGTEGVQGAPVKGGEYCLERVKPGKRKVVVSATPRATARTAPEGRHLLYVDDTVTRVTRAEGNGRVVDVGPGGQTLDLALRPGRRGAAARR